MIRFGSYEFDRAAEQLRRNGEPVALRPKAWQILCHLAEHPGRLVSTEELLDVAWPGTAITPNTLTNVISEVRRALDDTSTTPQYIETVHRRGYRFIAKLSGTALAAPIGKSDDTRAASEPALIGRKADLAQLADHWSRARRGQRQVVFIIGEPGIGKTTLVNAYVDELANSPLPPRIARASCFEQQGGGETYGPLLDLVERMAGERDGEEVVARLRQHAPTWLAQISSLVPAAERHTLRGSLVGIGAAHMLREGTVFFDTLANRQPLVLVIEDLHWADRGTLDLITALAQRRGAAPLMLLLTYRPVDAVVQQHRVVAVARQLRQQQLAQQLALAPFSRCEVQDYLEERFPGGDVGARLGPLMERHSGGNPLFVSALATHLFTQGWLEEKNGSWMLDADAEKRDIGLPDDIRSAVEAQLAALPPVLLRVLEAASVEGENFSVAAVATAIDSRADAVEDALYELDRQHHLIRTSEASPGPAGQLGAPYHFHHVLYQRAVYQRMAPSLRRQLHGRIGECLERAYGEQVGEIAPLLVVHFEAADDLERRVRYRTMAAENASLRFAYTDAVENLSEALRQIRRLPSSPERACREAHLELSLGNANLFAYGTTDPRVHAAFARAESLAREGNGPRELCRALLGLGSTYRVVGDVRAFEPTVRELLAITSSVLPSLSAQAHWRAGELELAKGGLHSARAHFEASLAAEGEPGIPIITDFRCGSEIQLAMVLTLLGFLEQGQRVADSALRRSAAGQAFNDCNTTWMAIIVAQMQRQPERTRALADYCAARAAPFDFVSFRTVRIWRQPANERDPKLFRDGVHKNQSLSGRWHDLFHYAALAETMLAIGDTTASLEFIEQGFDDVERLGQRWYEAELWRLKGEVLLANSRTARATRRKSPPPDNGVWAEGEACFRRAIDVARQQEAKLWELRAATSLSRLLRRQQRDSEARSLLAEIVDWFTEGFEATDMREARELLGSLREQGPKE